MGLKRYRGSNEKWETIVSRVIKHKLGDYGMFIILGLYELGVFPNIIPSEHTLEGQVNELCERYKRDRARYLEYIQSGSYVGRLETLNTNGEPLDFLSFICCHGGKSGCGFALSPLLVKVAVEKVEQEFKEEVTK